MPAGTTYLQQEWGIEVIPEEDVLDEIFEAEDHDSVSEEDFLYILK